MIILCNTTPMSDSHRGRFIPVAFLVAQVGAGAARQFAKALEPLHFVPADAGILRLLSRSPGVSQQDLAKRLDMHASRLVGVIDALEKRGLVAREPNPQDRRLYALQLTDAGHKALAAIGNAAHAHNEAICSDLSEAEREQLGAMLERIAGQLHLSPGVHPGYADMGKRPHSPEHDSEHHAG
jgi:DNA-binding MarR family transcriptional regulator